MAFQAVARSRRQEDCRSRSKAKAQPSQAAWLATGGAGGVCRCKGHACVPGLWERANSWHFCLHSPRAAHNEKLPRLPKEVQTVSERPPWESLQRCEHLKPQCLAKLQTRCQHAVQGQHRLGSNRKTEVPELTIDAYEGCKSMVAQCCICCCRRTFHTRECLVALAQIFAASGARRGFQCVEEIKLASSQGCWQPSAGHGVNLPAFTVATWVFFPRAVHSWLGWANRETMTQIMREIVKLPFMWRFRPLCSPTVRDKVYAHCGCDHFFHQVSPSSIWVWLAVILRSI